MRIWNVICLGVGTLGTALCLSLLLATYTNSAMVEQAFRALISQQVSKQVGHAVDAFDERFVTQQTEGLQARLGQKAEALRERFQHELPQRIQAQIASMQDPSCTCRRILGKQLERTELQMNKLTEFIQNRYATTVQRLLSELRLFSGINAASFALVALGGWLSLRDKLPPHLRQSLSLASALLIFATVLVAWLYLFQQNWLETLLFNSWVSWGYAAGLGLLFAWLCDLVLNRARVTLRALSSIGTNAGAC